MKKTKISIICLSAALMLLGCSSGSEFLDDNIIIETTSAYVIEERSDRWFVTEVIYGDEVSVGQRVHCSVFPDPERKRKFFILLFSNIESDSSFPMQSEFILNSQNMLKRYEDSPYEVVERIKSLKNKMKQLTLEDAAVKD